MQEYIVWSLHIVGYIQLSLYIYIYIVHKYVYIYKLSLYLYMYIYINKNICMCLLCYRCRSKLKTLGWDPPISVFISMNYESVPFWGDFGSVYSSHFNPCHIKKIPPNPSKSLYAHGISWDFMGQQSSILSFQQWRLTLSVSFAWQRRGSPGSRGTSAQRPARP